MDFKVVAEFRCLATAGQCAITSKCSTSITFALALNPQGRALGTPALKLSLVEALL